MKRIMALCLAACLCLLLCSCVKENNLVGTWRGIEVGWLGSEVTFNSNGTFVSKSYTNDEFGRRITETETGKWEVDDGESLKLIYMTDGQAHTEFLSYKVTNKMLRVKRTTSIWNWDDGVYERIK